MSVIFVARSVKLAKWGAEVGLGKHIFKFGCGDEAPEALIKTGWAGESDWSLVKKQEIEEPLDEAELLARLGRKEKMIDPNLYPRLKGATGIFKVKLPNVENHILVAQALEGMAPKELKLKPLDFASYLITNALPPKG